MCYGLVTVFNGEAEIVGRCGNMIGGSTKVILCPTCACEAAKKYPQGWRNVPGDICKHGRYVGNYASLRYLCQECYPGN